MRAALSRAAAPRWWLEENGTQSSTDAIRFDVSDGSKIRSSRSQERVIRFTPGRTNLTRTSSACLLGDRLRARRHWQARRSVIIGIVHKISTLVQVA